MFESPDDWIPENHFWVLAIIDSKGLTAVAAAQFFVRKVDASIS